MCVCVIGALTRGFSLRIDMVLYGCLASSFLCFASNNDCLEGGNVRNGGGTRHKLSVLGAFTIPNWLKQL